MRKTLFGIFIDHPASVGESYVQHMAFAARVALKLAAAAGAAAVHAVIPCLFKTTASAIILDLADDIRGRGREAPDTARQARLTAGGD